MDFISNYSICGIVCLLILHACRLSCISLRPRYILCNRQKLVRRKTSIYHSMGQQRTFHLLFQYVRYLITKSDFGVFLLEVLNFTLVLWCSYFFLCKYCSKKLSFTYILLFIASYTIINSGGNQVGDCTLLLSVISMFLAYNWSRKYQEGMIEHSCKYAFIYGLFFASCLFSRLTNAIATCASIIAISSILIFHGKWKK